MKNIIGSKNLFWNLTAMLIFIAVIYFLVFPVSRVLLGSLQTQEDGAWTMANFLSFIKYRTYWKSLANSVGVSLAASFLTIVMAVPLAFMVSRWNIKGKPFIIALSTIPLMLPSFISACGGTAVFILAGACRWRRQHPTNWRRIGTMRSSAKFMLK